MRDLTMMEIEEVSGAGFWDWLSGIGESISNAVHNFFSGTPGLSNNQYNAIQDCIRAGGSVSVQNNSGNLTVSFTAPTNGAPPSISIGSGNSSSTYSCVQGAHP